MSDDDASRTAVSPPLNCAKIEAASTRVDCQEVVEDSAAQGETVSEGVKVKPETEPTESDDVAPHRSDDHEAEKVKQRKCVQFTTTTTTTTTTTPGTTDDTLRKFIEGEEILDKRNPFKPDERYSAEQYVDRRVLSDKYFPAEDGSNAAYLIETDGGGNDADDSDTDLDDNVFITKEEILRQSKYVKTYIKNPDKQLNYDKSVIQKMNALKAKGREVRDVVVVESVPSPPAVVRPPIPAPRTIHRSSDRNNNSRRQPGLPQMERVGNRKPIPRARRDYAEVKVRTGSAEAEESLYDSNEVVQNALKFDSRFRKVEFGSQDDIDTIAERTEDGNEQSSPVTVTKTVENANRPVAKEKEQSRSPSKDQPDGRKSTFAEDVKKSFSNTVKSADFRKYLQSKGLSLVPAKPKAIESSQRDRIKHEPVTPNKSHRLSGTSVSSAPPTARQQLKPSVLTRFFQNSLFSPKTPNDPAYSSVFARSSTPVLLSTQSRLARPQVPTRFGSFNSSLNKRSAMVDVKPKVSFRQSVDGQGEMNAAPVRRPASVNDFERPKLRTSFANRSISSVDSLKRPMKNAGVQVNLATHASNNGQIVRDAQLVPIQYRSQQGGVMSLKDPAIGLQRQNLVAYHSLQRQRPDARFYGGSTHTVAPLYSEPLREAPLMVPDETDSGFRSTLDNGYHIYEQTPDNLRRGEMVYGKIGYLSNSQLNRWHPHDRRSYSSMQEGVSGMNGGGTYGRLRPLYVSSPMSTQSTPVRRASDGLDREQILHRIYDFCRRSIRNSSKTSVHSNQTEPTYQSNTVYGSKIVPSGSFPVDRQRVQRVQSLNTPRPIVVAPKHGAQNYTRAVPIPIPVPSPASNGRIMTVPANQHERNIENIYAFVNKKMVQMNVGADDRNNARSVQPTTLRRVTFSSNGNAMTEGFDEADYVNIRGAPDGIQYRTTQC